jgi:hypothetical protein
MAAARRPAALRKTATLKRPAITPNLATRGSIAAPLLFNVPAPEKVALQSLVAAAARMVQVEMAGSRKIPVRGGVPALAGGPLALAMANN